MIVDAGTGFSFQAISHSQLNFSAVPYGKAWWMRLLVRAAYCPSRSRAVMAALSSPRRAGFRSRLGCLRREWVESSSLPSGESTIRGDHPGGVQLAANGQKLLIRCRIVNGDYLFTLDSQPIFNGSSMDLNSHFSSSIPSFRFHRRFRK